mgnify:CR=1 FL=1
MPNPTPSDVHVDALLTSMSVGFLQAPGNFVADQAFPRMGVAKQSDKYATYNRGDFFRNDFQKRATATASAGIGYNVGTSNYLCEDWALHVDVADQLIANANDPFRPMEDAVSLLTQKERIAREVQWVNNFFATGVWSTQPTVATAWNDAASDPIDDIQDNQATVEQLTGMMPNTLICNRVVYNALRNHPDIVARISGGATPGGPAIAQRDAISAILGVDRILVSSATQNSADEGVTDSFARIAGNHALLAYVDSNPGIMRPTAGMTFVWSGYIGSAEGRRIKRFRIEEIESERVEMQANWDMKVISADLGVFFASVAS